MRHSVYRTLHPGLPLRSVAHLLGRRSAVRWNTIPLSIAPRRVLAPAPHLVFRQRSETKPRGETDFPKRKVTETPALARSAGAAAHPRRPWTTTGMIERSLV